TPAERRWDAVGGGPDESSQHGYTRLREQRRNRLPHTLVGFVPKRRSLSVCRVGDDARASVEPHGINAGLKKRSVYDSAGETFPSAEELILQAARQLAK